jgi:hypothetical protein
MHHFGGDGFLRLLSGRADMVRAVHQRQARQRVLERALARARLALEHIEPRADRLFAHRPRQRVLVDHFGARGVDKIRSLPHRLEKRAVAQVFRFRRQRDMHAYDVRFAGDIERGCAEADAELLGAFGGQRTAPCNHAQSERLRARNHLAPDVAHAD